MKSKILICSVTGAAFQWGSWRWIQIAKPKSAVAVGEIVQFDQHPHLLNCMNGVVDLRTGKLRKHDPKLLLTQICPVNYHPKAKAVVFRQFIARAMGRVTPRGRISPLVQARLDYLQKAIGYGLTGETSEKSAFVIHGDGATGKTTFVHLLQRVLGPDYAGQICLPLGRYFPELHRVRLAFSSEVSTADWLKEETLKPATASGLVRTDRKYSTPIEFRTTAKLFVDCNVPPRVRGSNDAIWRRLKLIQFVQPVPDFKASRDLLDRLMLAKSGVLAWAVGGAIRYYREGIGQWPSGD